MATVNIAGAFTSIWADSSKKESGIWHELHNNSAGFGGLIASGTLNVDRNSASDKNIHISGTAYSELSTYGSPFYDFDNSIAIVQGGSLGNTHNVADTDNVCVYGGNVIWSHNMGHPDCSYGFNDHTFEWTDNNTQFYICFLCHQTGGCALGYDGSSSSPNSEWVVVGYFNTNDITHYNPHQQPSISLSLPSGVNTWTKQGSSTSIHCDWNRNGDPHSHNIVIKRGGSSGTEIYNQNSGSDNGSFNQSYTTPTTRDSKYNIWAKITDTDDGNYNASTTYERGVYGLPSISVSLAYTGSITVGTANRITVTTGSLTNDNGSPTTVWIEVNGTTVRTWTNQSTGSSHTLTYDYTPSSSATTYNVVAKVKHDYSNEENNDSKSFKTYTTPTLSNISGTTPFSPQDSISYSWTNNSSTISNNGESSSQKISISNSSKTNVSYSNTSVSLAPSGTYWVQSIFTDSSRSVDQLSSTLTVTFTNDSSGVSVSKTKDFKVQYKPTKNLTVTSVENQGKTIAIDNDTKTTVKWTYPYNAGAAGVVSGFRVRVYSDSSYSTQVGNDHFITTTYNNYITGPTYTIDLDNASDLKRGVMNYVDITPYYSYPSGGTKSYGPTVQAGKLIKPYKYMSKPSISYPINNTTWHNKNFRVLLRLPVDNDYSTYTSTVQNAYSYSDFEIKINNTIYAFSGTYTGQSGNSNIFSSDINKANTNNHQKYIAINPSLIAGTFPDIADGGSFKISVRVQRGNYYFTNQEMQGQDSLGTAVKTWSDWSDEITLNKSSISAQNLASGTEIKASHFQTVHNWGLRLLACYPINSKDSKDVDQARGDQIDGSKTQTASGSDEYEAVFRTMQNLMSGVNGYCTYDRAPVKFNSNPSFSALEEIITSAESGTDRYGSTGRNYINLLTRYMNDYLK